LRPTICSNGHWGIWKREADTSFSISAGLPIALLPLNVVHLPFTYFPDPVGGTEVYVAALVEALRSRGVQSAIAAPAEAEASYRRNDVPVFRLATARRPSLEHAYGAPDDMAANAFRALIARLQPQIVHLHARTAAVSEVLVDIAHGAGAKVIFTYHTPAVSCARGTMMWMARSVCDGKLDSRRCATCVLAQHGVPSPVREFLACTPAAIGDALERAGFAGGVFTALRLPGLIAQGHLRFRRLITEVDAIVAVSDWVRNVLRINGAPEAKLTLCRHGLSQHHLDPGSALHRPRRVGSSALRLGYFGRLHATKGVDIVIEALRRAPGVAVELEIYGVRQPGSDACIAQIERAAAADRRIALRSPLPSDAVIGVMRRCDFVVVPSRWLETGPLVVLEAFAAGTPVLGARLGGIAELVTDEVDGVLIDGSDADTWAAVIGALAKDRPRIDRLRDGVQPPRTMDDVASEMVALYRATLR
jgi:glycosyltransferase involved in cell wall biosynthesis